MDADELSHRLVAMGIALPETPAPKGVYRPAVAAAGFVFTSGMGPIRNGTRHHLGYLGGDVSVEQGREAASIAVINALAAAIEAAGGISRIDRIVRITGFVRSVPGFIEQTRVVDGASETLEALLGEAGAHARSAVGVAELPFGIPVEIEMVASVRTGS